jgi:hypothetical protein
MSNPIVNAKTPREHARPPEPDRAAMEAELEELRKVFADVENAYQRAFLAAFIVTGGVADAARLAQVDRRAHYNWMERDDFYRERFELARAMIADQFEAEVWRRAFKGVDTPLHWRGEITAWYKSYSDALAVFALRALKPEAYRRTDPDFEMMGGPTAIEITIRKEGEETKAPPPEFSIPVNDDPPAGGDR